MQKYQRAVAIGPRKTMGNFKVSTPHTLIGVSIFGTLSPEVLASIEQKCRWRSCEKNTQIIRHQDGSKDVVFIVSGRARINIYSVGGRVVTFRDITAGDFVGELSAIDGKARSASIESLESCVVAYLSQASFWELLEAHSEVARALLMHLSQQVRNLTERIYEFSTLAVSNRIQAELLRLSREDPGANDKASISPAPTHVVIANRVATHREAVTRELRHLIDIGVMEKSGRDLHILSVSRLAEMVEDLAKL